MKTTRTIALLVLTLLTLNFQPSTVFAQSTAFTYQGQLNAGGPPASGSYDLSFAVFDSLTGGAQQGSTITSTATAISNGLFTVTLDFGNQFPGANRWLEISVRTNGGSSFTTLNSRQQITPSPYAITSGSANSVLGLAVQQNTSGAPNMIGGASVNSVSGGVSGA